MITKKETGVLLVKYVFKYMYTILCNRFVAIVSFKLTLAHLRGWELL